MDFNLNDYEITGIIVLMNQNGQMRLKVINVKGLKHIRSVTYALGEITPLEEYVSESINVTNKAENLN